jgi:hypothetical protein
MRIYANTACGCPVLTRRPQHVFRNLATLRVRSRRSDIDVPAKEEDKEEGRRWRPFMKLQLWLFWGRSLI